MNKRKQILKEKREKFGKSYFISTFNERRAEAIENDKTEVIMQENLYYMIVDCYDEIYQKFIAKNYKWKHIFELGYIIISWNRYYRLTPKNIETKQIKYNYRFKKEYQPWEIINTPYGRIYRTTTNEKLINTSIGKFVNL